MSCTQKQLDAAKRYRARHPEKTREASRKWRQDHPGAQAAATKRWAQENPEKARASVAAYRAAHPHKTAEWGKKWRAHNPDYSIKKYGCDLGVFIALAVKQKACCAVCGTQTKLCVDHDHASGKIRGLLCRSCNAALGLLKESAAILDRAADYIRRN